MEIRIVPFNGFQQVSDFDLRVKLLADLTHKSLLRAFSALNLSAREFPPALPLAISALGGEDLYVLDYNRGYYFYCLHYSSKQDEQR